MLHMHVYIAGNLIEKSIELTPSPFVDPEMTVFLNISATDRKGAELPTPRFILYPREKVRIGWKGAERNWVPGAGMINVGNTCYLNSTLQALFHVPAFANWLIADFVHRETCEEKSKCSSNSFCLLTNEKRTY